jgi:hypothetical protein
MDWKFSEGLYEVSSTGLVRRGSGTCLKTRLDRYGYQIVTLWVNGKALTRKVHRLVAIAFIENPLGLPTVNHLNGIKTDNNVSNLEWATVADNHHHAFAKGLHTIGENRKAGRKVKLTNADVLIIKEMIKNGLGNSEIGRVFGVSCGCIYSIRMNKSWSHIKLPPSE